MPERRFGILDLPTDTATAARSVFNYGNTYLIIGDQLDQLIADENIEVLDPTSGKPIDIVILHTMITIFQFANGLPDRLAVEASRSRMDWKYALHLPLNYLGLDPMSLCGFRQRLMRNPPGQTVFEHITTRIAALGFLSRREALGLNALMVIQNVCTLTRLDWVTQAFSRVLESLAAEQPEWLRGNALPHWYERYNKSRLAKSIPRLESKQTAMANALGSDARHLLDATRDLDSLAHSTILEIQNLQQVYDEQFYPKDHDDDNKGEIHWRPKTCATCNSLTSDSN